MDSYMNSQCKTMIQQIELFKKACEMAALKNDGTIDAAEAKMLKKINKASDSFIRDIQSLL